MKGVSADQPVARGRPSRTVLTYWPGGTLEPVHLQKDPGGIPIAIAEEHHRSMLLVRTSRVPQIPNVEVIEECGEGGPDMRRDLRRALAVLRNPEITDVLVIKGWKRQMLVTAIERLRHWGRPRPRWILKMDWGGPFSDRLTKYTTPPYLILASWLYDQIVVETSCAEAIARDWVVGPARLSMVPDGYSPHFHHPTGYRATPRSPIVLSVCRIAPIKRLEILIEAFAQATTDHPDWQLRLVGPTEDPDYRERLQRLIDSLRLGKRVALVGEVDDVREEYTRASVFCSTSERESFGISRIEAMINGLPVITTPAGCPEDLKAMGMVVVPDVSVSTFVEALRKLVSDGSLRERLGEQGLQGVLSWNQIVRALVEPR